MTIGPNHGMEPGQHRIVENIKLEVAGSISNETLRWISKLVLLVSSNADDTL